MKYGDLNLGQIEAVVNKLGGMKGLNKFLRGELTVSEPIQRWRERDGVIYLSLVSDGKTGPEWVIYLESKGLRISDYAKQLLLSPDFKPTNGVVYEIAILKGMLFENSERITKNIRAEAEKRSLLKPNAEVACLIRANFSDEELEAMGLYWIVTMHEPIKDSDDSPRLLSADRNDGGSWLGTRYDSPVSEWGRCGGFAFAVSQVELIA